MTIRDISVAFGLDVDQKSVSKAESSIKSVKSLATKLLGAIGIGFSLVSLKNIAEEFNGINDQIRGATRELGDQQDIQEKILTAANDTKMAYGDMAGIVTQLVKMDNNLFGDVESATAFATQTTKAMEAAGRSTAEVSTMQTQLNNVLAKGEMNTMTFTRMLKTYPEMINYIGEGLGKNTEELAAMADAGQLTSETIVKAFGAASDKIDKDFGELDFHISDAMTNIRNKWGLFVDQVWVGSGIANDFAHMMVDGFDVFLNVLKTLQPYIVKGIQFLIRGLQQVSAIVKRLQPAMERFTSSMRNGINKAVGVVKSIVDRLGGMEQAIKILAIVAAAFLIAMNWEKIISGAKMFMSLIGGIGKMFSLANLKILAVVAVIVILALIVEDFINFLLGNDSVIGTIFDKMGIGADNARQAIFNAFNKVKEFLLNVWDVIKTAAGMFVDTIKGFFERHGEQIRKNFERAWGIIKTFLSGAWTFISQLAATLFGNTEDEIDGSQQSTKDKILSVWQAILDTLSAVWDALFEVGSAVFNAIATVIETVFGWIQAFWNSWGSQILSWFKVLWDSIGGILSGFLDIIKGVANFISSVFTGDWQGAWEAIKSIFQGVWDVIVNFITAVWETIKLLFSMALSAIQAIWEAVWGAISGFFQGIWNGIVSFVTGVWNTITSTISNAINTAYNTVVSVLQAIHDFFANIFSGIANTVSTIFSNILSGITSTIGSIKDGIVNGFQAAIDFITGLPSQAIQWGKDFIGGLKDGIMSGVQGIVDAVKGIGDKIKSFLHFSVPDEGPLTDYESWMPDFMSGLAQGIGDSEDTVLNKVKGVANGIKTLMQGATASAATAASSQVNNTTSNMTQNVNINNSYSGGSAETQKNVSKAMNKSATDATTQMARGLAYARG